MQKKFTHLQMISVEKAVCLLCSKFCHTICVLQEYVFGRFFLPSWDLHISTNEKYIMKCDYRILVKSKDC
jgi:hypothetical protein